MGEREAAHAVNVESQKYRKTTIFTRIQNHISLYQIDTQFVKSKQHV